MRRSAESFFNSAICAFTKVFLAKTTTRQPKLSSHQILQEPEKETERGSQSGLTPAATTENTEWPILV